METFISAVLNDLVSRSVSFVVERYYRQQKQGAADNLQRLHRMLLRIQIIVEEAEQRHITNQAMLRQLQMLQEAMYEGSYLLDAVRYRVLQRRTISYRSGGQSSALSESGPEKHVCFCSRRVNMQFQGDGVKEVQEMLRSLSSAIDDMAEFIVFLKSYPPIRHEPYSKYMFLEKFMFGRQVEMEKIINFLLKQDPLGMETLQVLPIVGPPRVGKSTLVEHVCYDERVRNHFSSIILCDGYPTDPEPEGSRILKTQTHGSYGRSLVIIELADDVVLDESQCKKLYSSGSHMPPGSKVIITSRSENIVKLGTTGAIRLKFLPQEAYWYFFKVMAFGSTNPEEHPGLASIAMEISELLDGSFLGANTVSGMLRANLSAQFWRKILALQRNHVERNLLRFGEHPHSLLQKNRPVYLWTISNRAMWFKVYHREKHFQDNNEVPETMLLDVHTGSGETHGKFEVVVWKSHIAPYHSYLMSCEMEAEAPPLMAKKKRKKPHSMP